MLLTTMPEPGAFACIRQMTTQWAPRWFGSRSQAVMRACKLVEQMLGAADPVLHAHLSSKNPGYGSMVCFPRVLSLYSKMKPLTEVLRLWDLVLAKGPQHALVLCAAEFALKREAILAINRNPAGQLQVDVAPDVKASPLAAEAARLLPSLPEELVEEARALGGGLGPGVAALGVTSAMGEGRGPAEGAAGAGLGKGATGAATAATGGTRGRMSGQAAVKPPTIPTSSPSSGGGSGGTDGAAGRATAPGPRAHGRAGAGVSRGFGSGPVRAGHRAVGSSVHSQR